MQLAVLANDQQWLEWTNSNAVVLESAAPEHQHSKTAALSIIRTDNLNDFLTTEADIFIDLLFETSVGAVDDHATQLSTRVKQLSGLLPRLVIVNAVTPTLREVHPEFARVNGWNGFIGKKTWEIVLPLEKNGSSVETLAQLLSMEFIHVPDIAGMITPRIIAMIVNEGYFALGEGVSTKAEIDTAMKLGTNYPDGPFSWSEKIGLENIYQLLQRLSLEGEKYEAAPAMRALFN